MTLQEPQDPNWYMDSAATSHITSQPGTLRSCSNLSTFPSVVVGNGSSLPTTSIGQCSLYSINSSSTPTKVSPSSAQVFYSNVPSSTVWHRRLGHPGDTTLQYLNSSGFIHYNKDTFICHACQLGKQTRLPFQSQNSLVSEPFQIIHSDVWTSPIPSISGIKYYVLYLDHFSHYVWVYPLKRKSDVFSTFLHLSTYIQTQFGKTIKSLQCDNDGEYNNRQFLDYLASQGIVSRFSCPHTSQQNGKAERTLRTLNNAVRSLLTQANMPPSFWVEALNTAAYLLNILPSTAISNEIPFTKLFKRPVSYQSLRIFGCLCYPNLLPTSPHKLAPRSSASVFLGYPSNHKGYRCLDLTTRKIIISRHVTFDENSFPYTPPNSAPPHQNSDNPPPSSSLSHLLRSTVPSPAVTQPIIEVPPSDGATSTTTQTIITTSQPAVPNHQMVTRSQRGISKKKQPISLLTQTHSLLPSSCQKALDDPAWNKPVHEEYDALIQTGTWSLVPPPPDANIVNSIWLFRQKFDADGNLTRNKARLVANGKSQQQGVDCDETFSPVVKPTTIRAVLHLAVTRNWPLKQLDVKNAFLHGTLDETVYMHQPPGFRDSSKPGHVCLLHRPLYGLKQAPRMWYTRFADFAAKIGFIRSKMDSSLFILNNNKDIAYLLLYVDDIALTASSSQLLQSIINDLSSEFPMKDLGQLHHFLGISFNRNQLGLFLDQKQYTMDILRRAKMENCNSCSTPADSRAKLEANIGSPVQDPTLYRSLAGALQYLTFTRPDISYAVHQICLFMHDPREPHLNALKRILRYLQGTIDYGLQLYKNSPTKLIAYSDADWAGCPTTRRSTSGYGIFLGNNLVSWSSKRQQTVSRSSAEAEYRGVANAVAESTWLRNLLLELHSPLTSATIVYCDNISAVYLSTNPIQHQRTKHVEIDIHFVRERVAVGEVRVLHVPSHHQYADIFTKGLYTSLFQDFRSSLSIKPHT